MNYLEEFKKHANLVISQDSIYGNHLNVYSIYTADGYNIWVINESLEMGDIDPENDLFYYEPTFDDIMKRIDDIRGYDNDTLNIYCDDIDTFFEDYEMEQWLGINTDILDDDNQGSI